MNALETRIPAARKDALAAVAERRFSCRRYTQGITAEDWPLLSYLAGRCALPGTALALTRVDDSLFAGVLSIGRVVGCGVVCVVGAAPSVPHSREKAGFSGEYFLLEAEALGLRTCWITGSYRKRALPELLPAHMVPLGIIALGRSQIRPPDIRRHKPLEQLTQGDFGAWPEQAQRAAELVRLAPSAMNLQPWVMAWEQGTLLLDSSDRTRVDLGVAMCHAELALRMPHRWVFGETPRDVMSRAVCG